MQLAFRRQIAYGAAMLDIVSPPMPIPGHIDPVPVPRAPAARADGRIDLVGLSRDAIRTALEGAGLEPKQAKLRAKQIWHWIYNRGATAFDQMTDIAKVQHPWLAERFVIARPEVVEAQVSSDGTRKWLLRSDDGQDYRWCSSPMPTGEPCAYPARSAARSTAAFATPERCSWCATWSPRRSSGR
jgi:23S rRNA (adenine2503-C2)-methyltransferase